MDRVVDIAQYIFDEYKKEANQAIDEMKLHKLLYFAQRESFALLGQPLFKETFQGWKFGPVCPVIRGTYTTDGMYTKTKKISKEIEYIVKNIMAQYGFIESWKLSKITHAEISWQKARVGLQDGENGNVELQLSDIEEDAKKVRPYDSTWDMYYDEFDDVEEVS